MAPPCRPWGRRRGLGSRCLVSLVYALTLLAGLSRAPPLARFFAAPPPPSPPPLLLTIFTVLKEDPPGNATAAETAAVHAPTLVTVRAWRRLGPEVEVLLFGPPAGCAHFAAACAPGDGLAPVRCAPIRCRTVRWAKGLLYGAGGGRRQQPPHHLPIFLTSPSPSVAPCRSRTVCPRTTASSRTLRRSSQ